MSNDRNYVENSFIVTTFVQFLGANVRQMLNPVKQTRTGKIITIQSHVAAFARLRSERIKLPQTKLAAISWLCLSATGKHPLVSI